MELVLQVKPQQCTLVPDPPDALTSNTGWDTLQHRTFLQEVIARLSRSGSSPIDRAIAGSAVAITVESRFSMNRAQAMISGVTRDMTDRQAGNGALRM